MMMRLLSVVVVAIMAACVTGFVPAAVSPKSSATASSELYFGIPSFGAKDEADDDGDKKEKPSIDLKGLVQLITAGAGSPFLGDFEGVDEETGTLNFSLEANNLVDENGESKQTKMPFFESGWVDPEDAKKAEDRKAKGGFRFW